MDIISISEAKALKLTRYYTGKPCIHGHLCERKVVDRSCIECNKDKQKRHAHKATEWYHKNKDRAKAIRQVYYKTHKDEFIKRARKWEKNNPERSAELQRNWRRTEKGKAQSRNWTDKNRDTHYTRTKDWKYRNPDKVYEYTGTRRAAKLRATPKFITEDERKEIQMIYKNAKKLECETGVKQHVDHQIPLNGEGVSGRHVPENLRILTEKKNTAKGRQWDQEAASEEYFRWLKDRGL